MGLLKHFKSRSRLKDNAGPKASTYSTPQQFRYIGPDHTRRLPDSVLAAIFTYVCPHVADHTCEACESSQIGDGCMLCDLRELAQCAGLCRRWRAVVEPLLYRSIRIDAVHYCEREYELSQLRKKKHFRSKSGTDVCDPPSARLTLLCRTMWARPDLAAITEYLKIAYMTRETAKADLARTIAAMPNLRYVDLPDGFFTGDASCQPLRQELQARCHGIRRMTYRHGSENFLHSLVQGHWKQLEKLELVSIALDAMSLRTVLANLHSLRDLTMSGMEWLDDSIFESVPTQLADFPAVSSLTLRDTPHLSSHGLRFWLQGSLHGQSLTSLTLQNAGITVQDLHSLLPLATSLTRLAIVEAVSKPLHVSVQSLPPLTSSKLQEFRFEVTNAETAVSSLVQKPAESYYQYLAASIRANALPGLTTLYVRDLTFPDLLLLPPLPLSPFAASTPSGSPQNLAARGLNQTLEIFSKAPEADESDWIFTSILPMNAQQNRDSALLVGGRPLSAYSASRGLGPQWAHGGFGGEARRSVIVGNGFGGFLAVPQEEAPRPLTADGKGPNSRWSHGSSIADEKGSSGSREHERRGSKRDLWR